MKRAIWDAMTPAEREAYYERQRQLEEAWKRRQRMEAERRADPDGLTAEGEQTHFRDIAFIGRLGW